MQRLLEVFWDSCPLVIEHMSIIRVLNVVDCLLFYIVHSFIWNYFNTIPGEYVKADLHGSKPLFCRLSRYWVLSLTW
jgi:hypothetical protein